MKQNVTNLDKHLCSLQGQVNFLQSLRTCLGEEVAGIFFEEYQDMLKAMACYLGAKGVTMVIPIGPAETNLADIEAEKFLKHLASHEQEANYQILKNQEQKSNGWGTPVLVSQGGVDRTHFQEDMVMPHGLGEVIAAGKPGVVLSTDAGKYSDGIPSSLRELGKPLGES